MSIRVLRLGHRPFRDKRVTTHLMLAARAFGAAGALYTGTMDPSLEETIREVCRDWGGSFPVEYAEDWRRAIRVWKRRGKVVHLTMYGLPLREVIPLIRGDPSEKLVVVGGVKVPGEIYGLADWNVAVTSQPHSEVSALAVFLHELFEGRELERAFPGARLRVVPQERGKRVEASTDV
ncbi:MAG: tRNA (cytidine(56)-2'-O)-methyltransferase [Candidatus Bathyarchaeia archaeon]